jgi:hypothetical protein
MYGIINHKLNHLDTTRLITPQNYSANMVDNAIKLNHSGGKDLNSE